MKFYYVYIVECADGTYYTGITNDVDRRVGQHNFGTDEKAYTYSRRPVVVVFSAEFREVLDAIAYEKRVKGYSHAKKKAMIEGRWSDMRALSRSMLDRRRDTSGGASTSSA